MRQRAISRRRFLARSTAGIGAFTIVPRHVLGGAGHVPPSEQLTKAVIGVGGMGRGHLKYGGTKLLAVCDQDYRGQHIVGSVADASLSELWTGPALASVRRSHIEGTYAGVPLCTNCEEWHRP